MAHAEAKQELINSVEKRTGIKLERTAMTLGFARRATGYKRADLLLSDPARLRRIVKNAGPLQIIYGGKAHPRDESGKEIIRNIFKIAVELRDAVKIIYLEEYDMEIAHYICSGVDLWLNTPKKPEEASGTSGMKAALNGVPSLSILDGWWIEGHVEGVTGWSIGENWNRKATGHRDCFLI
jgi:starch phosphorylase